tara:strand:+ start:164 stop:346 length:183 start_codon:yes stop_codon:yes gene_type:complete
VDDIDLGSKLKRVIAERREMIREVMMDGVLKDMEHYKSLQGQLECLYLVEDTIRQYYKEV